MRRNQWKRKEEEFNQNKVEKEDVDHDVEGGQ